MPKTEEAVRRRCLRRVAADLLDPARTGWCRTAVITETHTITGRHGEPWERGRRKPN
ncbi:hypothetical protein [Amycolatopsis sp. FDAARGOS 1241]|uniref:hypothetical protein n=1 Tax=Amycolatopsis sp. FDAARGOS 1241 TaxID=2778070 RepID=UPI0019507A7C|nr:hypothetical protein [Amycolatopsis sp. FDAARGOS 1241]QRP45113.1 hypothetical protein I6J71_38990 [Amycolatopsis sp. FDAARGOS 1241]